MSKTADKVFEMLDAIVERIGEENIVQVITDNAVNYKAAEQILMEKRKSLFQTPCATHCIDLILEDFEKKLEVHQVTIVKGRRITSYIYLRTIFRPCLFAGKQFHWKVDSWKLNYFLMFGSVMKNKLENNFQCLVITWKISWKITY